jgi:hypothetical protein
VALVNTLASFVCWQDKAKPLSVDSMPFRTRSELTFEKVLRAAAKLQAYA